MSPGPEQRDLLLVHAAVDDELDPANAVALEERMSADPALAEERDRVEALRQALRDRLPLEPAPPALRERVRRAVGLAAPAPPRFASQPSWRALAASVALAAILSSGGTWYALRPPAGDAIAEAVVAGHLRGLMAPQPIDVASSDRHTVKPWFNGRVPQSPRVIDLASDGYPLVGGRIDVVERKGVPTLVYRHREHVISLTAIADASRDQAITTLPSIKGYNVIGWASDGIAYWAVSDVGVSDLNRFAQLFRDAPPDQ